MKINKAQVEMLKHLSDENLLKVIKTIGSTAGFDLSGINASNEDLAKVRQILSGLTDEDIGRASEIIRDARKKGQYGRE